MTPVEIAKAWHSVTDEWFVRFNKSRRGNRPWEVVHDWGGDTISDDTMKVVSRHSMRLAADRKAKQLEDVARGAAVLALIKR